MKPKTRASVSWRCGILCVAAFAAAVFAGWGCDVLGCLAADAVLEALLDDPVVTSEPGSLSFDVVEGDAASTQKLKVNCNEPTSICSTSELSLREPCPAEISATQAWLRVGQEEFDGTADIDVTVDPTGLAAGSYEGYVHLKEKGWDDLPALDVPVTLVVQAGP